LEESQRGGTSLKKKMLWRWACLFMGSQYVSGEAQHDSRPWRKKNLHGTRAQPPNTKPVFLWRKAIGCGLLVETETSRNERFIQEKRKNPKTLRQQAGAHRTNQE